MRLRLVLVLLAFSTAAGLGGSAQRAQAVTARGLATVTMSVDGPGTIFWRWTHPDYGDAEGDCPPACLGSADDPRFRFDLTADPDPGALFVGWSGSCSGTGACSFTTEADATVAARFVVPVTLRVGRTGNGRVTSAPTGIDCGAACESRYVPGTAVTLTAVPDPAHELEAWGGACSGAANTCTVTMDGERSVSAQFRLIPVAPVEVARTGEGTVTSAPAGIDCGGTCSASFRIGRAVVLTAAPAPGFAFAGWGGACSGTEATCTVTVADATSVSASFIPRVDLARAAFRVRWRESVPRGTLALAGSAGLDAELTATLVSPRSRHELRLSVPRGPFARSLAVPRDLLPGAYVLRLEGTAGELPVLASETPVRLRAPAEGVVSDAAVTRLAGGAPVTRLPKLAAGAAGRFVFAAKPAPRPRLTVSWYRGTALVETAAVAPAAVVRSRLRVEGGLARGVWTCVLRAHRKVVRRVSVRVA